MSTLPVFNVVTIGPDSSKATQVAASSKQIATSKAMDAHREAFNLAPGVTVLVFEAKEVGEISLVPK